MGSCLGMCRLEALKADSWQGEMGMSGCCIGEDGLGKVSPPVSVLTLKEVLFFLHTAHLWFLTFPKCHFGICFADFCELPSDLTDPWIFECTWSTLSTPSCKQPGQPWTSGIQSREGKEQCLDTVG